MSEFLEKWRVTLPSMRRVLGSTLTLALLPVRVAAFSAVLLLRTVFFGLTLLVRAILVVLFASAVVGAGVVGAAYEQLQHAIAVPPPEEALFGQQDMGLHVLDRNGGVLFEFPAALGGYRSTLDIEAVSPFVIQATIATEDAHFWEHRGLNLRGLARAAYENLAFWEAGKFWVGSGGSSIPQQIAKNVYVEEGRRYERDLLRKAKEMILALQLDEHYSKEALLERYLNIMYYGNLSYGIESASQRYFGKHARDLSLPEAAMLAGLPQAPTEFNPLVNPQAAYERQHHVLDRMVDTGYISPQQAEAAKSVELAFKAPETDLRAAHFVMHVRDYLPRLIGEQANGRELWVTTTLDPYVQPAAEQILRDHVARLSSDAGAENAALVALAPSTGEVLAMVGSPDYFDESIDGEVNNALAPNQPGSTIKPIVYLAAFLKGWSPATMVADQPLSINDNGRVYVLTNADNRYRGPLPVRRALANSLNPPAVQALQHAGLPFVVDLARRMGLRDLDESYGLAFALGGLDTTLLDMTFAYSVLANYGEQHGAAISGDDGGLEPVFVLRVEDAQGDVLYEHEPATHRVVPAAHAYLVTSVISDNRARLEMFGPGNPLELPGRPAAVKTGTTDGYKETLAIGFTPQVVAGVWVGNADNSPMHRGVLSSRTAGALWHDFVATAVGGLPAEPFEAPPGVMRAMVCAAPGPDGGCGQRVEEVFAAGQPPGPAGPGTALVAARGGGLGQGPLGSPVAKGCYREHQEGSSWPEIRSGAEGVVTCSGNVYYFRPVKPVAGGLVAVRGSAQGGSNSQTLGHVVGEGCRAYHQEGASWPERRNGVEGVVTCRGNVYYFRPA